MTTEENAKFEKMDRLIDAQQAEIQSLNSQLSAPAGQAPVYITYRNHRGETRKRLIVPIRIWRGTTKWYPYPQYLLHAEDVEKGDVRDFAMANIQNWEIP